MASIFYIFGCLEKDIQVEMVFWMVLSSGLYSLSVRHRQIKHYRIFRLDNSWYYISPRLTFQCLEDMINHYSGRCSQCKRLGLQTETGVRWQKYSTHAGDHMRRNEVSENNCHVPNIEVSLISVTFVCVLPGLTDHFWNKQETRYDKVTW